MFMDALIITDVLWIIVLSVLLTTSDYPIGIFTFFLRSDTVNLSFASCWSFASRWPLAFSLRNFGYGILIWRFSNRSSADGRTYNYAIFIILINQLSHIFVFFKSMSSNYVSFFKYSKMCKKNIKISKRKSDIKCIPAPLEASVVLFLLHIRW